MRDIFSPALLPTPLRSHDAADAPGSVEHDGPGVADTLDDRHGDHLPFIMDRNVVGWTTERTV